MSGSRLDKAEQRINELKNEGEEMQHRKMRRERMKEKLRGIEGRTRGSKLPLQGAMEGGEWR